MRACGLRIRESFAKRPRLHARALLLAALICVLSGAGAQTGPGARSGADYPLRPVRFLVPLAPGGGTDFVTRLLAQRMTDAWGQQVVVDNRAGANGIIAAEILAKSAPDGYTLLLATGSMTVNPALFRKLPYDTLKAFDAVALLARSPMILSAHPALGVATLGELIAAAQARPGQVTFASFGYGAMSHLAGEQLRIAARLDLLNVPYKGAGDAISNLLGGQVNLMFSSPTAVLPHFRSGRLKALALTGKARARAAPDIPTFAELGQPQVDADNWYGLVVPAGTPAAVVAKLHDEVARILNTPDVVERLAQAVDGEPAVSSPADFRQFMQAQVARWTALARAANLRVQD